MKHWDELTTVERVTLLRHFYLGTDVEDVESVLNDQLIRECTNTLSMHQRTKFVQYMDLFIAKKTYPPGVTDEEVRSNAFTPQFFWNYATASPELKGQILWHICQEYAP